MKQTPSAVAARLVALLNEIWSLEQKLRLADYSPYLKFPTEQEEIAETKRIGQRIKKIREDQALQKLELDRLVDSLTPIADEHRIDWQPVMALSVAWKITADTVKAALIPVRLLAATLGKRPSDQLLSPSIMRAWTQYIEAIQDDPSLVNKPPKVVYAHLKTQGNELPEAATWSRYIRQAKAHLKEARTEMDD